MTAMTAAPRGANRIGLVSRVSGAILLSGLMAVAGAPRLGWAAESDGQRPYVLQSREPGQGDRFVLDLAGRRQFLTKAEGSQIGHAHPLADCSDAAWFCAKGGSAGTVAWAIPRICVDAKVGTVWRHNGVDLAVLGRFDPALPPAGKPGEAPSIPADAQIGTELLLGSPKRPDIVYRYNQASGIIGAYFRRSATGPSPYDEARVGRIDRQRDTGQATLYRAVVRPAPFYPVDLARCRFAPQ